MEARATIPRYEKILHSWRKKLDHVRGVKLGEANRMAAYSDGQTKP
jgi:hypothetical protein